jgi:hypothetical protein
VEPGFGMRIGVLGLDGSAPLGSADPFFVFRATGSGA